MPTDTKKKETRSEKARRLGPATQDRLARKGPRIQRVTVPLDDDLAERVEEARRRVAEDRAYIDRLTRAGDNGTGPDPARVERLREREAELEELTAELAEASVVMTARALGRKRYEDLVAEHPPTKEHIADAKKEERKKPEFNIDTFPPALVQASFDPPLDPEFVEDMFDTWNAAELGAVFQAAYVANTQRRVVDVGEG